MGPRSKGRRLRTTTVDSTSIRALRAKGSTMTATRVEQDDLGSVNGTGDRKSTRSLRGADLVVRHLEAQGVRHVLGVPGAKIDRVCDALLDSCIKTVVGRNGQNASFVAQGIGRL